MQFSFTDEKIEELRVLIEKEFGEPMTYEEAQVMANNMLELYRLLSDLGRNTTDDPASQPKLLGQSVL